MTTPFSLKSQSGESLITVLVAVGIVGILSMVMMQVFSNHNQSQTALETRTQFEALRRELMNTVNCEETFEQKGCANPTPTAVKLRGVHRSGKPYDIPVGNNPAFAKYSALCHTPVASGDPVLDIQATRKGVSRSIYIGCGPNIAAVDPNGTDGKNGKAGATGTIDVTTDANVNVTIKKLGETCEGLGGIWDADKKCIMMTSPAGLVRRASTDSTVQKDQVIGCDIKTSGSGADMKTCAEAGTGKRACQFIGGNWKYIKAGKDKVCLGGIIVDTEK